MNQPIERRRYSPKDQSLQRSLAACWKEGIAAQMMITLMDTYIIPFGLLLGATNQQVGWLVAFPNLLGAVAQVWAVSWVDRVGSRMHVLRQGVFSQALFLLPLGVLPFIHSPHKILILIAMVSIYKIIGALLGPPWGSLVSEYLPSHRRGDYFGWRSRLLGITSLLTLAFWGGFLFFWKKWVSPEAGFCVMFLFGAVARFASFYFISQMTDLPYKKSSANDFTLWMFLKRFQESNFVKFVFYVAGITFTTHLAAPYFSVHMLRNLNFDYLSFMAISMASTFTGLIAFPAWGRHADAVGNARILKTTSFILPIIPLFWLVFNHLVPLLFVEAFAGLVWGGFNLCAVNYIYDAVTPAKRMKCLGYFNLINGLAIFAGSSLGGWLSGHLPKIFEYRLQSIFLLSSIGRLLVHFLLSGKFQEVRVEVKHISSLKLFFSVVGLQPLMGQYSPTPLIAPKAQFSKKPR